MKHLWIPLLAVLACGHSQLDAAPTAPTAEVEQLARSINDAWNAHSPDAWAPHLAESTTLVDPTGRRNDGKTAVLGNLGQPGPTKETTSAIEVEAVQWLADDTVLVDAVQTLTGPGVDALPASSARLVAVFVRDEGSWKVLALRPYIPVQGRE